MLSALNFCSIQKKSLLIIYSFTEFQIESGTYFIPEFPTILHTNTHKEKNTNMQIPKYVAVSQLKQIICWSPFSAAEMLVGSISKSVFLILFCNTKYH